MGTQAIVESQFNSTANFALSMFNSAKAAIDHLTQSNVTLGILVNNLQFTKPSDPAVDIPALPDTDALHSNIGLPPTSPAEPTFDTLPSAPQIVVPATPTLLGISIPDFISTTPDRGFASVVPAFTLEALTVPELTALNNTYASALNDAIRAKLLSNITDGGTGLSATVESAIFNREAERDAQALQDAIDKTTSHWAKLGFTLPDGSLTGPLSELNTAYLNKRLDTSRDISIEQAKLEQENLKYSLQYATSLEIKMIDVADAYANRALEAAKATVTTLIQLYNSNLETFKARVGAYRDEAEAYRAVLQSKAVEVDIYRAKIEGQKLIGEINKQEVELYNAQWEGQMNRVRIFEAQIRANSAQIEQAKLLIERYASQVQAFSTRANVYISQYNADITAYKSSVDHWVASSEQEIRSAEASLKADIANMEKYFQDQKAFLDVSKWNFEFAYGKLKDTAELSARVAGGALSASSAQATLGYNEAASVQAQQ